jgi:hypothetical protein
MKHPPYHLRPNKAVDRFLLIEVIRKLEKHNNLSDYTYFGLGGPYLEEFRLLYDFCPKIKMVSIERDTDTYNRQKFHLPCGNIELVNSRFKSYIAQYDAKDQKSIFWLDYTDLEYGNFEDFMTLLGKVARDSLIKISLRANPSDYIDNSELFKRKFEALMPDPLLDPPRRIRDFAILIQSMLRIAAEKALPSGINHTYQIVSSYYYADTTPMYTATGIVCERESLHFVKEIFNNTSLVNLDWRPPKKIDVPILSTKERLFLAKYLSCKQRAGITLQQILGYKI